MNNIVYTLFHDRVLQYERYRQGYGDPLEKSLEQVFIFSHYDDSVERRLMLEAMEEGYLTYIEHIPHISTDLFKLTEMGRDYIRTKMDFDRL